MIRKLAIAAGAVLVVFGLAAAALLFFVDANRFKPQIVQYVADRYQRTLTLDGDLALSLFPRLALALPRTTLSEPRAAAAEAARLGSARVSVKLLPLLRGEVVAERITIDGLRARVERRADGTLSVDDLLGRAGSPGEAAAAARQAPATAPGDRPAADGTVLPRIHIGGVTLSDAQFVLDDRVSGRAVTLGRMSLQTGRLANQVVTPVTLSLAFAATQPKAGGEMTLKADAALDLDAGLYGLRSVDLTLKGSHETTVVDAARLRLAALDADPRAGSIALSGLELTGAGRLGADAFEARITAPRLAIAERGSSGDTVQATLKLSGVAPATRRIDARIDAAGIGGTTSALQIAKLAVDASSSDGARKITANLATPVSANLTAGVYRIGALAGTVTIADPAIPTGSSRIDISGTATADTTRATASAELRAKADGTTLAATVGVTDYARPGSRIAFDVNADALDVDRYLPPAPAASAGVGPPAAGPAGAGAAGAGPAGGGTGTASADRPIDLSVLHAIALDGRLSVGRLKARGIQATDVKLTLKAADGRLEAAPITAALYGGRLAAKGSVRAAPIGSAAAGSAAAGSAAAARLNRLSIDADLTGVSIGPLLKDVADRDLLEGRGNVRLALVTLGGTVDAMKRALDGTGAVALRDGSVKGINLGETIRSARNLLQGGRGESRPSDPTQKTDFTELSVSFAVADGVATSSDLDVKSPLLRIGGGGRADLVAGSLDYTVRASVVGTSAGQGGRELDDLRGVTIPVRLTGRFEALAWNIDWATAGREALKSRAATELKERLKTDELEDKAKERLGDALKGLFRR